MPKKSKIIAFLLSFCLIFEQSGFAQSLATLDISSRLSSFHSSLIQDKFRPLHLRSLGYDNSQNNFKLLLDKGDLNNPKQQELETTTKALLNYFFVGVSLANEAFWVNLRPDSENNIIDPDLALTDVGKVLLEADLALKKDTASFTSPQTPEGKQYWDKLYQKAGELFGNENITIPTLTRPWIVPGEIIIRETKDNGYIYKATLKVMLEQDYLKNSNTYNFSDPRLKALNEYSSQLIRELIIPKLTKEVNTAQRYASLRQVYYSLILAQWFKARFYGKGGLYSWLINKKNLQGLTSKTPWSKTTYFNSYQQSFKNGEYNIQQPIQTNYGQTIRSYLSGGAVFNLAIPTREPLPGMPTVITQGPTTISDISGELASSPLTNNNLGALVIGSRDTLEINNVKIITGEASSPALSKAGVSSRAEGPLGLPAQSPPSGASSVSSPANSSPVGREYLVAVTVPAQQNSVTSSPAGTLARADSSAAKCFITILNELADKTDISVRLDLWPRRIKRNGNQLSLRSVYAEVKMLRDIGILQAGTKPGTHQLRQQLRNIDGSQRSILTERLFNISVVGSTGQQVNVWQNKIPGESVMLVKEQVDIIIANPTGVTVQQTNNRLIEEAALARGAPQPAKSSLPTFISRNIGRGIAFLLSLAVIITAGFYINRISSNLSVKQKTPEAPAVNIYKPGSLGDIFAGSAQVVAPYGPQKGDHKPWAGGKFSASGQEVVLGQMQGADAPKLFISAVYNVLGPGGSFTTEGNVELSFNPGIPQKAIKVGMTLGSMSSGQTLRLPTTIDGRIEPLVTDAFEINAQGILRAKQNFDSNQITYTINLLGENNGFAVSQPVTAGLMGEFQSIPAGIRAQLDKVRGLPDKERLVKVAEIMNRYFDYSLEQLIRLDNGTWFGLFDQATGAGKNYFRADCDVLSTFAYILTRYLGLEAVFIVGFQYQGGDQLLASQGHAFLGVKCDNRWFLFNPAGIVSKDHPYTGRDSGEIIPVSDGLKKLTGKAINVTYAFAPADAATLLKSMRSENNRFARQYQMYILRQIVTVNPGLISQDMVDALAEEGADIPKTLAILENIFTKRPDLAGEKEFAFLSRCAAQNTDYSRELINCLQEIVRHPTTTKPALKVFKAVIMHGSTDTEKSAVDALRRAVLGDDWIMRSLIKGINGPKNPQVRPDDIGRRLNLLPGDTGIAKMAIGKNRPPVNRNVSRELIKCLGNILVNPPDQATAMTVRQALKDIIRYAPDLILEESARKALERTGASSVSSPANSSPDNKQNKKQPQPAASSPMLDSGEEQKVNDYPNKNSLLKENNKSVSVDKTNDAKKNITNLQLEEELKEEITRNNGRIPFSRFMEICLYGRHGYYSLGIVKIGNDDTGNCDFVTAPEIAPRTFGPALAIQIAQMWENMGRPNSFQIVEMGAGNGTLAKTILEYLRDKYPDLYRTVRYKIVEISPALKERQKVTCKDLPIGWVQGSAIDFSMMPAEGVFISNELVDAFPVHLVQKEKGILKEIYVEWDAQNDKFKPVLGELSDKKRIEEYLAMLFPHHSIPQDAMRTGEILPINLGMVDWQTRVSKKLMRGYVITIDYGYDLGYADFESYSEVPLRAYSRSIPKERLKESPQTYIYEYPGTVDITSDVVFDVLAAIGRLNNLITAGGSDQYDFFKSICFSVPDGPKDELAKLEKGWPCFYVLVQAKGIDIDLPISGLKNKSPNQASSPVKASISSPVEKSSSSPVSSVQMPGNAATAKFKELLDLERVSIPDKISILADPPETKSLISEKRKNQYLYGLRQALFIFTNQYGLDMSRVAKINIYDRDYTTNDEPRTRVEREEKSNYRGVPVYLNFYIPLFDKDYPYLDDEVNLFLEALLYSVAPSPYTPMEDLLGAKRAKWARQEARRLTNLQPARGTYGIKTLGEGEKEAIRLSLDKLMEVLFPQKGVSLTLADIEKGLREFLFDDNGNPRFTDPEDAYRIIRNAVYKKCFFEDTVNALYFDDNNRYVNQQRFDKAKRNEKLLALSFYNRVARVSHPDIVPGEKNSLAEIIFKIADQIYKGRETSQGNMTDLANLLAKTRESSSISSQVIIQNFNDLEKKFGVPDGARREQPYVITNEIGWQQVFSQVGQRSPAGSVHIGFSGLANLEIIARRKPEFAIICDINAAQLQSLRLAGGCLLDNNILQLPRERRKVAFINKFINGLQAVPEYRASENLGMLEMLNEDLRHELESAFWLNDNDGFEYLQKMFAQGRIALLYLDIRAHESFDAIVHWMRTANLRLDTLYVSNIPEVLTRFGPSSEQKNINGNKLSMTLNNLAAVSNQQTYYLEAAADSSGRRIIQARSLVDSLAAASSPVEIQNGNIKENINSPAEKPGGIDFRALPILNQPINTAMLKLSPADLTRLSNLNLNSEWAQIQNMLNAGIIPSNQRIKEYVLASCLSKGLSNQMDKLLGCIADILRMEEDRVSQTEPELRDMLVLLEAGKPESELELGLAQIKISPKEPQAVRP